MTRTRYVVVTDSAGVEDAEAFGPFTSRVLAERFVEQHEEEAVRPGYPLMVVELYPVREGLRQVREEREANRAWS